ncbi:MAG: zinc-dependent peptidase [Cytophagales bacterium]|nr:zinc-dependent peptidase [Cytophagales bacterium]
MSTFSFFGAMVLIFILVSKRYYLGIAIPGIVVPISPTQRGILKEHFDFYNKLPPKSKKVFERRLASFIASKNFIPRDLDGITEEMRVLIAATAIQLAFGLIKINFRYFKYIIIYPEAFYSTAGQNYHYGEVNPRQKAIVLSWRNFISGLIVKDGRNLGLHEMAHALRLENVVQNGESNFLDQESLDAWEEAAEKEIMRIRNNEKSFFRDYAGTNHAEFFAVAVENFFERPAEFKVYNQHLYHQMRVLLNQDPMLLDRI